MTKTGILQAASIVIAIIGALITIEAQKSEIRDAVDQRFAELEPKLTGDDS